MFKQSRRKIILVIMGALILLFTVTVIVIMLASSHEMNLKYQDMLEHYVELYSLERQPGSWESPDAEQGLSGQELSGQSLSDQELPDQELSGQDFPDQGWSDQDLSDQELPPGSFLPDAGPDYLLSTFYSVAFDDDGTVLAIDTGKAGIYSEEELITIAQDILAAGKESGSTDKLIYIAAPKSGYTLVAFIDKTISQSSMNTLQKNVLIIGGTAIIILLFISFFLAKWIIRPLEENDQRQKRFISDASHELKTPVAVIGTNADLLEREIGENEWLSNIQYENERMGVLIHQLLDLSQVENKETQVSLLDFSRIAAGETLAFEAFAFDHGKTIHSDIEDGVEVTGSQTQLTQVVSVLLDNAIRHSTGSEIEISLKQQGHTAVLKVVNEGEELSDDQQEHLFDRFYRVDEVRNSEEQHYGLGLSIAKASVERHGGKISVSCHDGKVQFTVSIPARNSRA